MTSFHHPLTPDSAPSGSQWERGTPRNGVGEGGGKTVMAQILLMMTARANPLISILERGNSYRPVAQTSASQKVSGFSDEQPQARKSGSRKQRLCGPARSRSDTALKSYAGGESSVSAFLYGQIGPCRTVFLCSLQGRTTALGRVSSATRKLGHTFRG